MKLNELKTLIKSSVREVIREEMDYYFKTLTEKLQQRGELVEQKSIQSRQQESSFQSIKKTAPSAQLKSKYNDILSRMVFEETEGFTDTETPSILDESRLESMSNSHNLNGVYKALTRDYSSFVKAMDNN